MLGREIWEQTSGRVTGFCHGVGTAGSLMGVSEALKSRNPTVQVMALEPSGSSAMTGGMAGSFVMQGWTGIVPPHLVPERVDAVETIDDQEALDMTLRLSRDEGIFAVSQPARMSLEPSASLSSSAPTRWSSPSQSTAVSSTCQASHMELPRAAPPHDDRPALPSGSWRTTILDANVATLEYLS